MQKKGGGLRGGKEGLNSINTKGKKFGFGRLKNQPSSNEGVKEEAGVGKDTTSTLKTKPPWIGQYTKKPEGGVQ